jgi:Mlc titration factor MtfA (ptsG expression regulator)
MKIQPWQVVATPFGILGLILLYLTIKADGESGTTIPLVITTVILAAIYVLNPQINWWWWQRSPPLLHERATQMLTEYCGFYRQLAPEMKQRFRDRVALYILGNDFMRPVHPSAMDADEMRVQVPEDLKVATAAAAVQVTFGKPKFDTNKFEHIVLYPHPFPSPQFEQMHTCEIYEPDGVVMFDANTLMAGFNQPRQIFSIGLYEMARIFKIVTPSVSVPIFDAETLATLEKVSGMTRGQISAVIGLDNLDDFAVASCHFFSLPERFQLALPDLYQLLVNIYQQNPVNVEHPVVNY